MTRKILLLCIFIQILIKAVLSHDQLEREFDNDLHLTEEETGGKLHLRSQGNLSNIVDLDRTEGIKVRKNMFRNFNSTAVYLNFAHIFRKDCFQN